YAGSSLGIDNSRNLVTYPYMATRPKDSSSVVGKDKKTTPSSSTTKRIPIKTSLTTTSTSSREKSTTTSDKINGPNSLKSKLTSQATQIPKLTVKPNSDPSSNNSNGKPIGRRSIDKPVPPSGAQIKKQPSSSRQQKSLASLGPRERSTTPKKSIEPLKSVIVTTTSKSMSSDKTPHLRPISNVKSVGSGAKSVAKKSVSSTSSTNTKKVVGSTKIGRSGSLAKKGGEEISIEKVDDVENSEEEVKETIDEEKEDVMNALDSDQENNALENLSDIEFFDDQNDHHHDRDHDNYHDHKVEEYDDQIQVQDEDNNEKIISTISVLEEGETEEKEQEEEVEVEQAQNKIEEDAEEEQGQEKIEEQEDEEEKQEEKIEVEEEEKQQDTIKENDDNKNEDGVEENIATTTNQEEDNNIYLKLNQPTIEEAKVNEIKEEENHNVEEAALEIEENKVNELENEDKATQQQEEQQVKEENKEKVELSPSLPLPSQSSSALPSSSSSQGAMMHGKKEAQVSNGVIEETANKLLDARKNKVRALAGAFQSVIDYQKK
ncbi:hypothetical protein PIB30_042219, partial [Stylosanthes scabra]|nr:hypothetical protein [Stylosanthes scabra]